MLSSRVLGRIQESHESSGMPKKNASESSESMRIVQLVTVLISGCEIGRSLE